MAPLYNFYIPLWVTPPHPFPLQAAEETLHHGIVPTVAFATHAADKALAFQEPSAGFAR